MSDDTEFVIVPQGYPIWAVRIFRDKEVAPEPVVAWRIAVNDSTRRPVPISPMRGELNIDDIGDFLTTSEAAEQFEETIRNVAMGRGKCPTDRSND